MQSNRFIPQSNASSSMYSMSTTPGGTDTPGGMPLPHIIKGCPPADGQELYMSNQFCHYFWLNTLGENTTYTVSKTKFHIFPKRPMNRATTITPMYITHRLGTGIRYISARSKIHTSRTFDSISRITSTQPVRNVFLFPPRYKPRSRQRRCRAPVQRRF